MVVEEGRVCVKIAGREAGKRCAIVDVVDENFVVILGEGVKKRRCNVNHLEFLSERIEVENESDEEILKKLGKTENEQPKKQPERQPKKRTPKRGAGSKK